ncbi:LacI family DNA-binding transcriptional regulator [Novosphingobium gossypii]|uniref:LacI family DNA-binding transcriptional regulator n=1 Tax=Novosphingobium gossypii TaxID=1604774 RepID=UPI003D255A52
MPAVEGSAPRERVRRRNASTVTILDVAEHAGVSPMTVSRVINEHPRVRETTKNVVNEAIAALNYSPNPAARNLAGVEEIKIGILYRIPSAAYLSEFLIGGIEEAGQHSVRLIIQKKEDDEGDLDALRRLLKGGVGGVILPPPICDNIEVLDFLRHNGIPTVLAAADNPSYDFMALRVDDYSAARRMTEHLLEQGHLKIAFITGNQSQHSSSRRLSGYRDALMSKGIAFDESLVAEGLFTYKSGIAAANKLLSNATLPTAIFASNDDMAAASIAVAYQKGLSVPSDLSVVGFDDTILATAISPELTTIHQPIAAMSRRAIRLLLDAMRGRRDSASITPRHEMLPYTFIQRESDAAAPGGNS